jgi:hypothetical protein
MSKRSFTRWSLIGVFVAAAMAETLAQSRPATRTTLVSARLVSPICKTSAIAVEGSATGDVTGTFAIAFACNGKGIIGGSWRVTVTEAGADGVRAEVGMMGGRVVKGSFQMNGAGVVYAVQDVVLDIRQGAGRYAAVQSGSGKLDAVVNVHAVPQVRGSLDLIFDNVE